MRQTAIDKALDELNAKRGLTSRDIGYSYYANIRGDGSRPVRRSVYTIINAGGGVTYSNMNGAHPRATLDRIREEIALAVAHKS